jgi:hypothetical protein
MIRKLFYWDRFGLNWIYRKFWDIIKRGTCMGSRPLKNAQFCLSSRKAKILTGGIYGIFRGLNFEPDIEIGQKGVFFKGLGSMPGS